MATAFAAPPLDDMQKERKAVTLIRKSNNLPNEHCFILEENSEWFLVQCIDEFHLDGYALIAKKFTDKIRYNKFDKELEKIIHFCGIEKRVKTPSIDLEDDKGIFDQLKVSDPILSIEDEIDERYIIGRIETTYKSHASFKHFDATGKWFKRNTTFQYSEMTRINFRGEYESTWKQYQEHIQTELSTPFARPSLTKR